LEGIMGVALVTGASGGIGLATAVTLARAGHAVIATMRNPSGADESGRFVREEKIPVEVAALNVDEDASVREAIGRAIAERGHMNNAGVGGGRQQSDFFLVFCAFCVIFSSALSFFSDPVRSYA
jgi:NAD(P)-dependent dehydrogenase (short-subunit alcohol dehydrogenase family)